MVFLFYVSGIVAVLSTICVILQKNPMHAVLYLIVSFLSISCVFFSLGAFFAGAIEIIVYAGAVMILFIFIVMMFNTEDIFSKIDNQECNFLHFGACCGVVLSASVLCIMILLYIALETKNYFIYISTLVIDLHQIGCRLFGFYVFFVEMASFLLLGALVSVLHIFQEYKCMTNNVIQSFNKNIVCKKI